MLEQVAFSLAAPLPENTFIAGKTRIQFITPALVRLEWCADGRRRELLNSLGEIWPKA